MDSPRDNTTLNTDNGKHRDRDIAVGFRPQNGGVLVVEPPRREDLQPSYAQQLQGDHDVEAHGWYGGMSKSIRSRIRLCANVIQSIHSDVASVSAVPSHVVSSVQTHTNLSARVMSVLSPSSVASRAQSILV